MANKKMNDELAKKAVAMLKKGAKPGEIAEKLGVHHLSVVAVGRTAGVFKAAKPKTAKKIRAANGKIVKAKPGKSSKTSSEFEQWFNTGLSLGFIKMRMENDALKAEVAKQ